MDDKQMQRANDMLAGMQELRDAANNRVVQLLADLKAAMRGIEDLKAEIELLKRKDDPELPNGVGTEGISKHIANAVN